MRIFHCDHCDHLVFFENHSCVSCGRQLAFLPDIAEIGRSIRDPGDLGSPLAGASPFGYRLCANYTTHNVCNWAIPADDPSAAVLVVPPDARHPRSVDAVAARSLGQAAKSPSVARLQRCSALRLLVANRVDDPGRTGSRFEFLADPASSAQRPVLTGHRTAA